MFKFWLWFDTNENALEYLPARIGEQYSNLCKLSRNSPFQAIGKLVSSRNLEIEIANAVALYYITWYV